MHDTSWTMWPGMRKQGLWAHEIWLHFYNLKFNNFLHKHGIFIKFLQLHFYNLKLNNFFHNHGIFIKFLLLVHQCVGNIMQLTDLQYLLPKRRYVILCKQVCFVPISLLSHARSYLLTNSQPPNYTNFVDPLMSCVKFFQYLLLKWIWDH